MDKAIKRSKNDLQDEEIRDAVIQRFEYTYEKKILDNIEKWFIYREQRNITSHTYDRMKAVAVQKTAFDFFDDVTKLFQELKKR